MSELFRFDDVSVERAGRRLLDSLSVSISSGGVTGVVGPSGSGKTTLLRLCNRLEVPTDGRVLLEGVDLAVLDPLLLRRRVGMVFQRPALFPGTVADNLAVAEPGLGEAMMAELMERVGLDPKLLSRTADDLSGGEAQRACLARTLVTGPEVLLMDEPTASVDPSATGGLEQLARSLASHDHSVIWVTHDLAQLRRLAERVLVLIGGRLRLEGSLADLAAATTPEVRAFVSGGTDAR